LFSTTLLPGTVAAPFTLTLCSAQEVTLVEFPESQACVVAGAWAAEGGGQGLTLVHFSAQLELTFPLSAQLRLTLFPV